jgi:hypothetical protein
MSDTTDLHTLGDAPDAEDPKNEDARAGTPSDFQVNRENKFSNYRPPMLVVRPGAPHTSREAVRRAVPFFNVQRATVLAFVIEQGEHGATDAEIAGGAGMVIQSVNPRRGELAKFGYIVPRGDMRASPRTRPARVWIATVAGRAALAEHAKGHAAKGGGDAGPA